MGRTPGPAKRAVSGMGAAACMSCCALLCTSCTELDQPPRSCSGRRSGRPLTAGSPTADPEVCRRQGDPAGAYRQVALGLCEDYPPDGLTFEEIRRDFELLQAHDTRLLRISVPWGDVEPAPGQYRFDFLDQFVALAREHGLTLAPYICYTPRWNSAGGPHDYWRNPPVDFDAFERFMERLAGRYRESIRTWEIWNEPDNSEFWAGSVADYARLLNVGARAVRRGNPQAQVVVGGISWNTDFLLALFRDHDAARDAEIVNLHNYYETWIDEPAERVTDYVARAAGIIDRYGEGERLWMAEVGYSTFREGRRVSAFYSARHDYEHTPAYQATYLVRMMALLMATERLDAVAWYEVRDLPLDSKVIGDVNNRHLGITDARLRPKPALAAYGLVKALLSSPHRCISDQIRLEGGTAAVAHGFERADGMRVVFAWLPARGTETDSREQVTLTLPLAGPVRARFIDAVGSVRSETLIEPRGDRARLEVPLVGGDVTVMTLTPETSAGRVATRPRPADRVPLCP